MSSKAAATRDRGLRHAWCVMRGLRDSQRKIERTGDPCIGPKIPNQPQQRHDWMFCCDSTPVVATSDSVGTVADACSRLVLSLSSICSEVVVRYSPGCRCSASVFTLDLCSEIHPRGQLLPVAFQHTFGFRIWRSIPVSFCSHPFSAPESNFIVDTATQCLHLVPGLVYLGN